MRPQARRPAVAGQDAERGIRIGLATALPIAAVAGLANVTATTLAGYGLAWLRFRSGSLAAPAVAHASLNAAAYLAARFAVGRAA